MKENWLQPKGYVHMDIPFMGKSRNKLRGYILNKENIARHSFLPLIRREVVTHPFKINEDGRRKRKRKVRDLTYASHVDAAIFAYYAEQLQAKYEEFLLDHDMADVVTAYRKIKCENRRGNKCNIDIANDIFGYIKNALKTDKPLAVVTFDIKGFSYVNKSAYIMGEDAIHMQLRRCTNKLSKAITKAKNDVTSSIWKRLLMQYAKYGRIY